MDLGGEAELLPEAFEDAAEEIGRVEAGQGHQQLKQRKKAIENDRGHCYTPLLF